MSVPAIQGSATNGGTNVVSLPTSWAAGEVCLLVYVNEVPAEQPANAGWTLVDATVDPDTRLRISLLKRALQSGDTTFTFTSGGGFTTRGWSTTRWPAGTIVGTPGHAGAALGVTSLVLPSVTTVTDDCLVAVAAGREAPGSAVSGPGSMTKEYQLGSDGWTTMFTEAPASGASGTRTLTWAYSGDRWAGIIVALSEAPAAQTVAPSGIASAETFGTPQVNQTIYAAGIASGEAFGTPTVTGGEIDQTIYPSGIASAESFGVPTVAPTAPEGDQDPTLVPTGTGHPDFVTRWASGLHVGDQRPSMVIEVRRGRWRRGYYTIPGDEVLDVTIDGEIPTAPWMAYWDPAEDWQEIPGVAEYSESQSFDNNGLQVATIIIDNVRFTEEIGVTALPYHATERGYASPTRGYAPTGRIDDGLDANEWYDRLGRMAQIRVWQGYGDPERELDGTMPADGGDNGLWVFAGQIDDLDLSDLPDRITLTVRNGQSLTDQEFFGWNKSKQLKEPVVFADRTEAVADGSPDKWILVDDVADIVRVVLRWAGYRDWAIETTGVRLKGHVAYDRQSMLIEPIQRACEQTGYGFFMAPPLDGDRLALPVFRSNRAREAAPAGMVEVAEDDLLTGIQYKHSMEPLAYIIRVRGKNLDPDDGGVPLGGDSLTRIMSTYRPPWSYQPGDPDLLSDRLAGLLKHVTLTRPQLRSEAECEEFAKLLAFNEALAAIHAMIEIPGHPDIWLDTQVGVTDTTSAVNSRMWVSERANMFASGEQTSWKVTLSGPLLDFPDVAAMIAELDA